jgi:hypothetical protein
MRTAKGGAHGNEGAYKTKEAQTPTGARTGGVRDNGGRARPRGAYACVPNDGHGLMPCSWRGTHTYAPIIGVMSWGRARLQGGGYICLTLLI